MHGNSNKKNLALQIKNKNWLGKYPGKTLQRLGASLAGIWIASNLLRVLWPEVDQIATNSYLDTQIKKTSMPSGNVSLLIIGKEHKEQLNAKYPNTKEDKIKTIKMIIINKKNSPKIISVPTMLSLGITDQDKLLQLNYAYKIGGIALTYDLISNILKVSEGIPRRYIYGESKFINDFIRRINPGENNEYLKKRKENIISSEQLLTKFNFSNQNVKEQKYKLIEYKHEGIKRKNKINNISLVNENLDISKFTKELMKSLETNLSFQEFRSINSFLLNKSNIIETKYYKLKNLKEN
tara:strand:- start:416 stop:1300 length:885 start_codon:yes stop_codon:yes gene_type:complete